MIGYEWCDLRDPKKYDLEMILRLVPMIEFLKEELHPISQIIKEAVRRSIIRENERNSLFVSFKRVNNRINLFEGAFFPSDQSPSGMDRWEYKLEDITREEFIRRIEEYNKTHFKTSLSRRLSR